MITTTRTTLRLDSALAKQAKFMAIEEGVSFQVVINHLLAIGIHHKKQRDTHKQALERIDAFRRSQKPFNVQALVEESRRQAK